MPQKSDKSVKFDRRCIPIFLTLLALASVPWILFFIHEHLYPPVLGERDLGEGILAAGVLLSSSALVLCALLVLLGAFAVYLWNKLRAN